MGLTVRRSAPLRCPVPATEGGSGGGGLGGGSGGFGGPPSCGSRKVLQAQECTPDTPGGTSEQQEQERKKKQEDFDKECDAKRDKVDVAAKGAFDGAIENCKSIHASTALGIPVGAILNLVALGAPMRDCLGDAQRYYESRLNMNRDNMLICKSANPYK